MALVIFKSRANADIMMIDKHAQPIIELLGKDIKQGIIPPEETASAIEKLEKEIERIEEEERIKAEEQKKQEEETAAKEADDEETDDDNDNEKKKPFEPPVRFAARCYPFLQMLKAANKAEESVFWGV